MSIKHSNIDQTKLTFVLTHGYLEHGNKNWIQKMKDELLVNGDYNVIVLDWLAGSGPPYTQATANIRLVAVIAARFLVQLENFTKLNLLKVHIIGHSLGAHLSGYIGSELRNAGHLVGRITGLDPAEPNFEGTDPIVRLDSSDAYYVDVIHTDANPILSFGLGMWQPCGHLDFYPNGGKVMEGCQGGIPGALMEESGNLAYAFRRLIGCNHIRAYEYFTESINSKCPFMAVECSSWEEFMEGQCNGCTGQTKQLEAIQAMSSIDKSKTHFSNTIEQTRY